MKTLFFLPKTNNYFIRLEIYLPEDYNLKSEERLKRPAGFCIDFEFKLCYNLSCRAGVAERQTRQT